MADNTNPPSGTNPNGVPQTRGSRASGGIGGTGTNPATNGLGNGFSLLPAALTRPSFWTRVGVFALGVVLVWGGILVLIASNKNVQNNAKGLIKGTLAKTPGGVAANVATGALA